MLRSWKIVGLCFIPLLLNAAPNQRRSELEEMRSQFYTIQHQIRNQQVEIKIQEEKLGTVDATIDTVVRDLNDLKKKQNDKLAASAQEIEAKIGSMELTLTSVIGDLKTLKSHNAELTAVLTQIKNRCTTTEKVVETQNRNIEVLQTALGSLIDSLQNKNVSRPVSGYSVKSGDSLEKIARANKMTIEELKELNHLTTTKIIIGQKLLVYDK